MFLLTVALDAYQGDNVGDIYVFVFACLFNR